MVALSGLNTASLLLQQIVSNGTRSSAQPQTATSLIAQTASGVSTATGSATKSVSSAIFNAVTSLSEKEEKTVKDVLDYIDRTYTNYEKQWKNSLAMETPERAAEIIAHQKEIGENLKQQVLADPKGIHKLVEQLKTGRPEVSKDGIFGFLIAELGNRNARVGNVTAPEPTSRDPAEGAMEIIFRIQSEFRSYEMSLGDKVLADMAADIEQSPITQIMNSLAAGKDITEAMAQAEVNREKGIELSESAKLSEGSRQTIDGFSSRIKTLTDKLSQFATIQGNILVKKDDGTYGLGTFEVRDKSGTVNFSADAEGQVRYVSPRYNATYFGHLG